MARPLPITRNGPTHRAEHHGYEQKACWAVDRHLVFLLPALRLSGVDLSHALKERVSAGTARGRLRQALVVAQIALALVLLAGAGLLMRTFYELNALDLGFNPENLLTMQVAPLQRKYGASVPLQIDFARRITQELAQVPGVRKVGIATNLPLLGNPRYIMRFEGRPPVTVANAPPTATLSLPAAVDVGSPVAVTVTGQTDPSPVDRASPFRYSYSFNGDTIFTDAGDVQNSLTPTASFTYQTTGTKTIRVRITDKDGGFSDVVQTVVVENVQPTLFVTAPASVTEGGTATLAVSATSPSTVTTGTGFRYAFDFDGDGLFDLPAQAAGAADPTYDTAVTLTNGRMVVPAQYTADGPLTRTVRVRVFEKNGPTATPELSTDKVVTFNVLNAAPTATLTGPTGQIEVGAPVTIAFSNQADASPADAAAGFNYSFDLNNDGDFTDLNEVSGSASPSATVVFANNAVSAVRGRITDKDGAFTDYTVPVSVRTRAKIGFAAGVDAGNAPKVQLYDRDGNPSFGGLAFDPAMTAGVRVATGDFNGDGVTDIVAGTGPGVVAEVRVIDGKTGAVLFSSRPFEPEQFTGGLFVAAGDMDGDGRPEIAVSPDQGGGPRVILYRGLGFIQVNSFFGINDPAFRGGARVAMADMNGDGRADLLVSAGFMGGPRVAGFDGAGLVLGKQTKLFADFFAFEDTLRNGVYLAGGDVNGDGIADLVVGAGPGGSPRVTVYDGAALRQGVKKPMANFTTGNTDSREGVRVAVTDVDGDNLADVVTGEAGGPRANVFYGKELSRLGFPTSNIELTPFSTPMNGIFVG